MSVITLTNKDWSRHHDPRTTPIRPNVARITCFDTVEDLINICKARPAATRFKGSGSHWGLSEAALSDHDAIETNWPGPEPVPRHSGPEFDLAELHSDQLFHFLMSNPPGKAETLTNDPCLQRPAAGPFYVHIKSGTRVYEAYTFLDQSTAPANSFGAKAEQGTGGNTGGGRVQRAVGICDARRCRRTDGLWRADDRHARRRLPAEADLGQRGGGSPGHRRRRPLLDRAERFPQRNRAHR